MSLEGSIPITRLKSRVIPLPFQKKEGLRRELESPRAPLPFFEKEGPIRRIRGWIDLRKNDNKAIII